MLQHHPSYQKQNQQHRNGMVRNHGHQLMGKMEVSEHRRLHHRYSSLILHEFLNIFTH